MILPDSLAFLGSTRFWKLVLAASLIVLGNYGVIDMALAEIIAGALGISITIRTVDRAYE
jgi:small basic protein